jgi:hypothetical protein
MRANTLFGLFNLAIAYSMRWLNLITQIETPSVRYVKRLRTQPMKSTSGPMGLKGKPSMGRILDPDWRQFQYVPAAKTDLKASMERYKEMVRGEGQGVRPAEKKTRDATRVDGQVSNQPEHSLQGSKFAVIRGKG